MASAAEIAVHRLDWDSEFWGRRVSRIDLAEGRFATRDFDAAVAATCASSDFVQLLVPAGSLPAAQRAEAAGFRLVDLRAEVVTEPTSLADPGDPPAGLRRRRPDDVATIGELAAVCHDNSRFANDAVLDPALVGELYRRWIARDVDREGWDVDVLESDGTIVGYVTHGPAADGVGTIGLIGVDPAARGAGAGALLIGWATHQRFLAGARRMSVVTQGGSTAAMRTYRKLGYQVASLGLWLHWHREQVP